MVVDSIDSPWISKTLLGSSGPVISFNLFTLQPKLMNFNLFDAGIVPWLKYFSNPNRSQFHQVLLFRSIYFHFNRNWWITICSLQVLFLH
jgi:hypothetical protein